MIINQVQLQMLFSILLDTVTTYSELPFSYDIETRRDLYRTILTQQSKEPIQVK